MSIKQLKRSALFLLPLANIPSVWACEANSLSIQPVSTQAKYDVFNNSSFATTNTYRVSANIIGEGCKLNLVLQLDDTSKSLKSSRQDSLFFEWSGQSGNTIANQWRFTLTENQPAATVQMRFPAKQWLTSGIYRGVLEVATSYAQIDGKIEISPTLLPVTVDVPPAAKIHFYGLSQPHYDLDLGTLHSNKVINSSPNLWVQSNSAYAVVLESSNHGALRHESHEPKWDIPYQIIFDNDYVNLTQFSVRIPRHAATTGQPIPLIFVIGNAEEKPGGQYEDTLQISIEPNLSQQP
ncbi:hypothetical protein J4H39_23060 [Vibrio alginolyticus]|uniref:hypothetical protein n=1 Tax=Vibrio TaxID=662 RepID=UPI001469F9EC|nr:MULTISPECIES: hypothetical protein [Vibrio]MDF4657347.1 hypothetical protein [Vibrio parahaemolyticus]MBS9810863.1 hypothetical protein [Vibrio alginolyticus]MBS9879832.1 hypothetical protein [Vibrio alginolyticus]MBS9945598.1 hypothetical protein [Vibrio alginolyticus]MBT0000127.1 hypothetical protein [Vibrio alginolyticus]